MSINTQELKQPVIRAAIDALQAGDREAWFAQFTHDAKLLDDGNPQNFTAFFNKALGHERFTSIDKIADEGKTLYGHFHSDTWGDFKTYFKFHLNAAGKIERLEIGQAS
jgi:hypothetical protein